MNKAICLESVDSTNAYLRRESDLPHGTVVISDAQSDGRGRLGRSFVSAAGKGVYMSVLLRPDKMPRDVSTLTPNVAVAVCRAINTVCGVTPEIKWVNDLLIGGKKICGILCESVFEAGKPCRLIVGIGINVLTEAEDFPEELRETAGSILSETGKRTERGRLTVEIVKELELMYERWLSDERIYLEDYRRLCTVIGKKVRVISPDGEETAFAESLSDDFGLTVVNENGRRTLRSGEISVR